ncbi:Major Facilitator Superfamily protein [Nakamurella panacisegetis]|uniref:Major Facilitator Superfamily protein n=1 Tax=Nakamurella panacisegetis TaxID=1090615 RepID=A0A1H0MZS2_9ACTN|nr:MFS transporter [Nakamurella panacisegetis]SDO85934.1 Major Facilitator Superfamily protein [Nakamurella panacisegetis]
MTIAAPPARPSLFAPGFRAVSIAGVTMVGVQAFEAVAVSTAMPTVAAALGGLNGYALAFGVPAAASIVGMVSSGSWSDRRGPVGALAVGWLLFVTGLLVAGLSTSMTMLIGGRALQGLGSGLTSVALYVVVAKTYPESLRPRIFSAYAAAWVLPALLGPVIAGFVVVHLGWRWVFLLVPFIAVAAAVAGWGPCRRLLAAHDPAPATLTVRESLRRSSFAVMAGLAACLLSVAGQTQRSVAIPAMLVGVLLLVVAIPKLLPSRTYRSGRGLPTVVLLRGLTGAAFTAAEVFLPLLLSRERGLSPTGAGIVLTVGALGWSAGSAWQGRVSASDRRPALLRLGLMMLTIGIAGACATVFPAVPLFSVYVAWTIAGLGIGIAYPTMSVLTLELSATDDEGRNSSALQVNEALLQAITLAVSGTVFAALIVSSHVLPYLAGFTIAAGAAATGAVLASRVRLPTG